MATNADVLSCQALCFSKRGVSHSANSAALHSAGHLFLPLNPSYMLLALLMSQ